MSDRPGIPWGCYGLRKFGWSIRSHILWQHVDQMAKAKLLVEYAMEEKRILEEKAATQIN